ncbi:MAG: hypothetical protein ABWK00_01880 [Desulfurococcaceae archaeon]
MGLRLGPHLIGAVLVALGVALILFAAIVAYESFVSYALPQVSASDVSAAIVGLVSALATVAIKLGFLGIIVWGGGIILRNGVSLLREERGEAKGK